MTISLIDGFDLYNGTGANTGLQAKWIAPASNDSTVAMATGRFGGQCFQVVGGTNTRRMWGRTFTAVSSVACGFAFRSSVLPPTASNLLYFMGSAGATFQDTIQLLATGAIVAGKSTNAFGSYTTLGTSSAGVIVANTWHYIEVELVIHDTTGSFKVWVDGVSVLSVTSVDTRSNLGTDPATTDTIFLGTDGGNPGPVATYGFDDFYVNDTNTHLGERRVETLYPTSDVAQGFTRSTGSTNYTLVDEAQANGDTDYVQASTVSTIDTYGFGDLTGTPATIDAVQVAAFAEKTDATTRAIALQVISSATTSVGPDFTLAASYSKFERLLLTDPNGSIAWAAAAVNALTGGPKVTV